MPGASDERAIGRDLHIPALQERADEVVAGFIDDGGGIARHVVADHEPPAVGIDGGNAGIFVDDQGAALDLNARGDVIRYRAGQGEGAAADLDDVVVAEEVAAQGQGAAGVGADKSADVIVLERLGGEKPGPVEAATVEDNLRGTADGIVAGDVLDRPVGIVHVARRANAAGVDGFGKNLHWTGMRLQFAGLFRG